MDLRFDPALPRLAPRGLPISGSWISPALAILVASLSSSFPASQALAAGDPPAYLQDRGTGLATSLFGTYVRKGEFLVYPFYEYTTNSDQEYKPSELGFTLDQDFRGKLTEHEALLFLGYGLTENVAFELESALYSTATLHKASNDPSSLPDPLTESGLGDTQAEVRWRWSRETERSPELLSSLEVVFPLQRNRVLIGTSDWEFVPGLALIKGTRWGTLSARGSVVYQPDGTLETDEFAVEYLKRTSQTWRWVLSVEGGQDEWSLIGEAQLHVRPNLYLKLNSGVGFTDKAPDFAPEVGAMISF